MCFYNIHCGAKGSRDSDPFHIKPKAHAKEEEMPENEQRKSKLPGYTAEDDPILDPCPRQIKITEGESAASPKAIPLSIPKKVSSPMGQP